MDYKHRIKTLEEELERVREEEASYSKLPSQVRISNRLHADFCHFNHVDGCGWEYFPDHTNTEWHAKAGRLLAAGFTEADILRFLDALRGS